MPSHRRILKRSLRSLALLVTAGLPLAALAQAPPPEIQPGGPGSIGAQQGGGSLGLSRDTIENPTGEIVDRTRLRVCADPGNLPYSNEAGEGFENKIAELIADELGVPVTYTWFPQTIGFVRMTLAAERCDVIIGVATTNELMQNTNPYYRSTYVIVHRPDLELESGQLDDPVFKDLRLGLQPGTPGTNTAARDGLLAKAKFYPLVVDTRIEKPARDMVRDVADGATDVALVWGPLAGYWVQQIDPTLVMQPLAAATGTERVDYRISMGIRYGEPDWKEDLNQILLKKKPEIDAILQRYSVPLLDNSGDLILPTALPEKSETDPVSVPEPDGYRTENYRAPVPDGVTGATTVDLAGMRDLAEDPEAVLIDVMPAQRKPEYRPADAIWREPERETIAGAHWLANMGYGELLTEEEAAFREELKHLAGANGEKTLVFFCEPDCWMSWNAAKRAVSYGFENVVWFPDGTASWIEAGLQTETMKPWRPPASTALAR